MKTCKRFHFEDIERGDFVRLEDSCSPDQLPDVTVKVVRTYRSYHFGPALEASDGETYYFNDYNAAREAASDEH